MAGGIVTEKASFSVSLAVGLAAVFAGSLISVARADLIVSDDQVSVIPSDIARPSPGMTMQKVEQNASFASVYAGALAEGLAATGALQEALHAVEGAIADAERRRAGFNLPELHRLKGVLLLSQPHPDERIADEAFANAFVIARHQGALAWQLRAETARARMQRRRDGSKADVEQLAALYSAFTEGMTMPDLQAARSVLEQR